MTKRIRNALWRATRGRQLGVLETVVVEAGCYVTLTAINILALLLWGLPLLVNQEALARMPFYDSFPLLRYHVWGGLALSTAVYLRWSLALTTRRHLFVAAGLAFFVWTWATVAFLVSLGLSTALIYAALAAVSVWTMWLTRFSWVSAPPSPLQPE